MKFRTLTNNITWCSLRVIVYRATCNYLQRKASKVYCLCYYILPCCNHLLQYHPHITIRIVAFLLSLAGEKWDSFPFLSLYQETDNPGQEGQGTCMRYRTLEIGKAACPMYALWIKRKQRVEWVASWNLFLFITLQLAIGIAIKHMRILELGSQLLAKAACTCSPKLIQL